ncbi:MAG: YidB family protein [Xanthobacteraceae bacterium]
MGLMDVLNGMRNGPRGAAGSKPPGGGMSPLTMALLGLLAYKAMKGGGGGLFGGHQASPAPASPPRPAADAGASDWLGGLGKMLAGGAAGGVLTGGLGELMRRMQQSGQNHAVDSWVGSGPNRSISPTDLEHALGQETLEDLSRQTGMPRNQLATQLAEELPQTVDTMTPDGRLPTETEANRWA